MNESKNINALDPDMTSAELDHVTLDSSQKTKGILLFILCTVIGIAVFFCSITHADGSSETIFSFLYNGFLDLFGSFVYWILCIKYNMLTVREPVPPALFPFQKKKTQALPANIKIKNINLKNML